MQANKKLFLKKLGLQLKKLRKNRNMTQAELAYKIGKDQQSIQRLESGIINPTLFYLNEIAQGLNIAISCFFSFEFYENVNRKETINENKYGKIKKAYYKTQEMRKVTKVAEDPGEFSKTIHYRIPREVHISSYHREIVNHIREEILFLKKYSSENVNPLH